MIMAEPGKVLLVDDDRRLNFVLAAHLKNSGFDVRTATNGRDGVAIANTYLPDVIVMDLTMPIMDGVEAIARIKQNPATQRIPIIILTADPRTENLVLGLETGAQEYVVKPFAMEELVARVRAMHRLAVTDRELDQLANQLTHENHRKTRQLRLLYTFADQLNKASTLDQVLDLVVACAQQATDSHRISLMLRDDDGQHLVCRRAIGIPPDLVESIRVTAVEGVVGNVFTSGRAVRGETLTAPSDGPGAPDGRYSSDAFVCAPLILNSHRHGREVLGVLNVTEKSGGHPFSDEDTACIQSIADSAAIAIHNQLTRTRLERSVHVLLMTVGRLAEYRDEETARHLERVQDYARLLAEELARKEPYASVLTPDYIENLFLAAPLHDIGKVGIPDTILTKSGPLSRREFEIMKTHTTIGRQTLELAQSETGPVPLLQMCIDIAHCHHEKYDGSGYPQGLVGQEIPLSARIIALADAYDAVTSRRRYKDPVPHEEAVNQLRLDDGKHFDPDVMEVFENCLDQFDRVRREKGADTDHVLQTFITGPTGQSY